MMRPAGHAVGATNVVAPCRMLGGAVRPNIDDLVENSYETLE